MAFKTGGVGMKKKIALLQGGFNVEIMKEVMHGVLERTKEEGAGGQKEQISIFLTAMVETVKIYCTTKGNTEYFL